MNSLNLLSCCLICFPGKYILKRCVIIPPIYLNWYNNHHPHPPPPTFPHPHPWPIPRPSLGETNPWEFVHRCHEQINCSQNNLGLKHLEMCLGWTPFRNSLGICPPTCMCFRCLRWTKSLGLFSPISKTKSNNNSLPPPLPPPVGD